MHASAWEITSLGTVANGKGADTVTGTVFVTTSEAASCTDEISMSELHY